eukprot:460175-Rhodomonas_salina.1
MWPASDMHPFKCGLTCTDFGDTAKVPTNRGSQQGDTLSPSIFPYFINLCLCLLDKAGVGYEHQCRVRRTHTAFVDDIALVTTSAAADMNSLIKQVSIFSEWSCMDLCVPKCKATAYDYKTNTELLSVDTLHVGGKLLMPLAANKAFKYLGVSLTTHCDTSAEVAHIMMQQKTFHGLLTAWRFQVNDLDNLPVVDQWGLLLKRAWHLTYGQGVAMLVLPLEMGCIADQQPAVLLVKHTINLTMSLVHSLDWEMLLPMEEECRLCPPPVRGGGVETDLPPDQRSVLVTALLLTFPGTSAHSLGTKNNLTSSLPTPKISESLGCCKRPQ